MTSHLKSGSYTVASVVARRAPAAATVSRGLYRNGIKRVFDVLFVLLSAPITLPLIGFIMLIAACDGVSPFYTQLRVGRGGRSFKLLKIRTMVLDSDALLEAHLAENPQACAEWDRTQKLKNDPRITRIGKILRKSSLDELPQFWNVLMGDMSLIGPRPMMVEQKALYPGMAYYGLRPGITGSWQVSDRNESSFAARAKFDTDYDNNLSLMTDLDIFVRTIGVVLRCTGY